MKAIQLFEYRRDLTLQNFGNKLHNRSLSDRGQWHDGDVVLDKLEAADPTSKKAFVLDLIRWYLDGSMRYLEDASKATEPLRLYAKFKNRGLAPLAQMSFPQLLDLGDELSETKSIKEMSKEEEEAFYRSGDADLIKDTPNFKIVVPRTEDASRFFGRNTRWCTAAENDCHFDYYDEEGPLYIIIFKGQGSKKWQFHFESNSYMDENDDMLEGYQAVRDEPEVMQFFRDDFIKALEPEFLVDRKSLSDETINKMVNHYAPNIRYFSNPPQKALMRAAEDGRVKWDYLPLPMRRDCEAQMIRMRHTNYLDNYFEFPQPTTPEVKALWEKELDKKIQGSSHIINRWGFCQDTEQMIKSDMAIAPRSIAYAVVNHEKFSFSPLVLDMVRAQFINKGIRSPEEYEALITQGIKPQ